MSLLIYFDLVSNLKGVLPYISSFQVLYLDIKKDSEHERLLELAKAFRDHMQASGEG